MYGEYIAFWQLVLKAAFISIKCYFNYRIYELVAYSIGLRGFDVYWLNDILESIAYFGLIPFFKTLWFVFFFLILATTQIFNRAQSCAYRTVSMEILSFSLRIRCPLRNCSSILAINKVIVVHQLCAYCSDQSKSKNLNRKCFNLKSKKKKKINNMLFAQCVCTDFCMLAIFSVLFCFVDNIKEKIRSISNETEN